MDGSEEVSFANACKSVLGSIRSVQTDGTLAYRPYCFCYLLGRAVPAAGACYGKTARNRRNELESLFEEVPEQIIETAADVVRCDDRR